MISTVPTKKSLDEAQHWLAVETHFGAGELALDVRKALRGGDISNRGLNWLEELSTDPEYEGWVRAIREELKK